MSFSREDMGGEHGVDMITFEFHETLMSCRGVSRGVHETLVRGSRDCFEDLMSV